MPERPPDQIAANWSALADDYERSFEGLSGPFAAEALRRLGLRPGEELLDIAAGTGALALQAARAGAKVLATDFAEGMVTRLRARIRAEGLEGIRAEVMDGQALALPDGGFDVCASVLGLIFFPDIPRGLAEMRRVLRPGGRAAVVCWADPQGLELMTRLVDALRQVLPGFQLPPGPPVWARLAGAEPLRLGMQAAGFREVEVSTFTGSLQIPDPETFWTTFTRSGPPLAFLFDRLGPEQTEAVGRAYVAALARSAEGGPPTLRAEACIGIGGT